MVAERRSQALRLRRGGARYRQIASALNVSVYTAHKDVQEALLETNALSAKQAAELRGLENERLDHYLRALQPLIDGEAPVAKLRAMTTGGRPVLPCAIRLPGLTRPVGRST